MLRQDAYDLIHSKIQRYRQYPGFTDTDLKNAFTNLISISSQYSQDPGVVHYIPVADDVEGKSYNSLSKCAAYLATDASVYNQKVVKITTTYSTSGALGYARLTEDGSLYDYVNYIGSGHHCKILY